MTGGLGFARTGENSLKHNKALKNSRSRMKDNPYAAANKMNRQAGIFNYKKLRGWMNYKNDNEKKTRRIIYIALTTTLFLFLIIIRLIN